MRKTVPVLLGLLLIASAFWLATEVFFLGKTRVGAITEVTEVSSGITFAARVDTGAAVSSIHCDEVIITDEAAEPRENLGKVVRFLVVNDRSEQSWIETEIVDHDQVRTSDATKRRYYVRLRLRCAGVEKETRVTLKDRSQMQYKLLLGRDFLKHDFVVDVGMSP